jgi:hypothetical protein
MGSMLSQIGFTTASLIFVVACVGFCVGALANVYLTGKVAFGKLLVLGDHIPWFCSSHTELSLV